MARTALAAGPRIGHGYDIEKSWILTMPDGV
jgi:hypothetical protein